MQLQPLAPFGVELQGFTYGTASKQDLEAFDQAFREYSLVLIRDPQLTDEEQVALMSRVGPVAREAPGGGRVAYIAHDPVNALPQGSAEAQGKDRDIPFGQGELAFHFDMSYTIDWPMWAASLYGVRTPSRGGETRFLHCGRIYAKLDEQTKQDIAGRMAIHIYNQENVRGYHCREQNVNKYALRSSHPLVRPHPYGGGDVLTAMKQDTDRIVGMKPENSERILNKLFAALADTSEVLEIHWQVGDLVIWDNRVVQHARNDFDPKQARILRRVGVGDEKMILLHIQNTIDQLRPGVD